MTRPSEFDADLFADDGLHPSAKMYELWMKAALPEVIEILERETKETGR